jgi:hypothetical protein
LHRLVEPQRLNFQVREKLSTRLNIRRWPSVSQDREHVSDLSARTPKGEWS